MIDRHAVGSGGRDRLAAAVEQGVDWVQVRERELEGSALLALVREVGATLRAAADRAGHPLRLLVNRRIDVALAAGADGVHLGFDAVDPETARKLLGPGALVGVSCHAPAEVAALRDASYAHLAPVYPPLSKPSERPPLGPAALAAAAACGLPVLAQGGITTDNVGECLAAGAAGVAVTGSVLAAGDPAGAAAALRGALDAGSTAGPGGPKTET